MMNKSRWARVLLIIQLACIGLLSFNYMGPQMYDKPLPPAIIVDIGNHILLVELMSISACIISLIFYFYSKNIVSIIISLLAIIYCVDYAFKLT